MRWLERQLEKVWRWADVYAWTIPGLLLGFMAGVVWTSGPDWLETASYLGTFVAAFLAFIAVRQTQRAQALQARREREARQPSVVLSKPLLRIVIEKKDADSDEFYSDGEPTRYSFLFDAQNISSHSVVFREAFFDSDMMLDENLEPHRLRLDKLVAPNETEERVGSAERQIYRVKETGYILITFSYGATGALLHIYLWEFGLKEWHRTENSVVNEGIFTPEPSFEGPITRAELVEKLRDREQLYRSFGNF